MLVVEDVAAVRQLVVDQLTAAGYRVLLMSGDPQGDDEGFDATLLKPFETSELLRVVAELCA